jgi:hypothetical protein
MHDGTPLRHRADLAFGGFKTRGVRRGPSRGEGAHVCLGPSVADGTVSARGRGPQLQNFASKVRGGPALPKARPASVCINTAAPLAS